MNTIKKRTFFIITLSLTMIATMFAVLCDNTFVANAATTGTTSTGLEYEITNGSVTITGYTGKSKSLTVPQKINGYKVTQIGSTAFFDCDTLENVKLPVGIKNIGVSAFLDCNNLKSVNIPSGVTTIERYTFSGCNNLASIFIPSSVKTIGDGAFEGCASLTKINIPANVTQLGKDTFDGIFDGCVNLTKITVDSKNKYYSSYDGVLFNKNKTTLIRCPEGRKGTYSVLSGTKIIGDSAFKSCSKLTKINIATSVKLISHRAFYYCNGLTSLNVPLGVTEIEHFAFESCYNLKTISLPSSLSTIDTHTFDGCNLEKINVSKYNKLFSSQDGILFNKAKSVLIRCPEGRKGTYTIPASVTTIEEFAFACCDELDSVDCPSSVKKINNCAFEFSYTTIYCEKGSCAEKHARENYVNYKAAKKGCYLGNGKFTATICQPSFKYTGNYIKPIVTVKGIINGKKVTLTNWKDYKVTYKNFRAPGTATITVTGRGDYAGTLKLTFTIRK